MAEPTSAQHLTWAKQNEKLFGEIRQKWPDWAATVLFYVAMHEVQALILDKTSKRPEKHNERKAVIRSHFPAVWQPYDHLLQLSRDARYSCYSPTDGDLNDAVLALTKFRMAVESARTSAAQ